MNKFFPKTAIFSFVAFALTACGGGNSASNNTPTQSPVLKTLEKEGSLAIGSTLKAKSTCGDCDGFKPVYTWTIDKNNNGVFGDTIDVNGEKVADAVVSADEYTLVEEDLGLRVKLEAFLANADGSKTTDTEYVEYQPSIFKQFGVSEPYLLGLKSDGSVAYELLQSGPVSNDTTFDPTKDAQNVKKLYWFNKAVIVLKSDGSVQSWVKKGSTRAIPDDKKESLSSGVVEVISNDNNSAFAALKGDGSVVTWGNDTEGGNSDRVQSELSSGVEKVFANKRAFVALKADKSVVVWGAQSHGGEPTKPITDSLKDVQDIYHIDTAFAAKLENGEVIFWGRNYNGSEFDGFKLDDGETVYTYNGRSGSDRPNNSRFVVVDKEGSILFPNEIAPPLTFSDASNQGVKNVFFTKRNEYIAVKDDGLLLFSDSGIEGESEVSNVVDITSGSLSAALLEDGSVTFIGDSASVPQSFKDNLTENVKEIVNFPGREEVLVALKNDNTLVVLPGSDKVRAYGSSVSTFSKLDRSQGIPIAIGTDGSVKTWLELRENVVGPTTKLFEKLQPTETKTSSLD